MTQAQFYFCLSRILKLREKIKSTYDVRRKAQVAESTLAEMLFGAHHTLECAKRLCMRKKSV
jgi:hypothetical protein